MKEIMLLGDSLRMGYLLFVNKTTDWFCIFLIIFLKGGQKLSIL